MHDTFATADMNSRHLDICNPLTDVPFAFYVTLADPNQRPFNFTLEFFVRTALPGHVKK